MTRLTGFRQSISVDKEKNVLENEKKKLDNNVEVLEDAKTENTAEKVADVAAKSSIDYEQEQGIVIADQEVKKKRIKSWAELNKKERKTRVFAVVTAAVSVVVLILATVFCCIFADIEAKTPQWATEYALTKTDLGTAIQENGDGVLIPDLSYAINAKYYLVAKEKYDLKQSTYPTKENLLGYRASYPKTNHGMAESKIFNVNVLGFRATGAVLSDKDGAQAGHYSWSFVGREKVSEKISANVTIAVYTLSAVIDGHLYRVEVEIPSASGGFTDGELGFAKQAAKQVGDALNEMTK